MVVLFARDENGLCETETAMGAGALVRIERVTGTRPAVSDEIGLCIHCDGGGMKVVWREVWWAEKVVGDEFRAYRRGAEEDTARERAL